MSCMRFGGFPQHGGQRTAQLAIACCTASEGASRFQASPIGRHSQAAGLRAGQNGHNLLHVLHGRNRLWGPAGETGAQSGRRAHRYAPKLGMQGERGCRSALGWRTGQRPGPDADLAPVCAPPWAAAHRSPARYSRRAVYALTKGISLSARISGRTPCSTRLWAQRRGRDGVRGPCKGESKNSPQTAGIRTQPRRSSLHEAGRDSLRPTASPYNCYPSPSRAHPSTKSAACLSACCCLLPRTWNLTMRASRSYQPSRSQKAATMEANRAALSCGRNLGGPHVPSFVSRREAGGTAGWEP